MPVEGKNPRVRELEAAWETVADVTGGPRTVRAKTVRYVPKLPSHSKKSGLYEAYLGRAVFNPVAQRTLRAFVGLVCADPPAVTVPDETILADVAQTGVSYHDFARDVFRQAMAPGRVGILVDLPVSTSGARPRAYQRTYAADAIVDWREETVAQMRQRLVGVDSPAVRDLGFSDATRLTTHLRLLDRIAVPDRQDPWNTFPATQVRVIDLVDIKGPDDAPTLGMRIQLWRQPLDDRGRPTRGKFVLAETLLPPARRGMPIPFVPFVPINTLRVGLEPEEPALLGLCELNVSQFRSSADLENGRYKLGHPHVNVFGVQSAPGSPGATYEMGDGVWEFSSADSRVEVLQVQDQFGGLERAIAEKGEQMVAEGARLMAARDATTPETATAARLKAAGERSLLVMAAQVVGQGLQRALAYHAWMEDGMRTLAEVQQDVSVSLREDFDESQLTGAEAEAWLRTQVGGGVSRHTLRHLYRLGGVYPEGWTDEDEAAAIEHDRASALADLDPDGDDEPVRKGAVQ